MRILMILFLLTGCGPTTIMLKNKETGQIARCYTGIYDSWNPQKDTENCAKAHEKNGYERIKLDG